MSGRRWTTKKIRQARKTKDLLISVRVRTGEPTTDRLTWFLSQWSDHIQGIISGKSGKTYPVRLWGVIPWQRKYK